MGIRRFVVNVTTAADGTATAYTPFLSGKVAAIHYIKTDFATGVDLTITAEATAEGIWTEADVNASKACYPRAGTHSNAGVASLYASGGVAVNDLIRLGRDRIKIAIAQGGNAKVGQFLVVIED